MPADPNDKPFPFGPPPTPPQPAIAVEAPTVINVPVPEGTVDLLDPAVIEREVERGKEENEAEYGHE